jgi:hypothetical protein
MYFYQVSRVLTTIGILSNDAIDFVVPYNFYYNSDNDEPMDFLLQTERTKRPDWAD